MLSITFYVLDEDVIKFLQEKLKNCNKLLHKYKIIIIK